MSPNRTERARIAAKSKAIRNELARLQDSGFAWPDYVARPDVAERAYRGGTYEYDFHPATIDDPAVSSRMYGPQMKSVQWEPTKQK